MPRYIDADALKETIENADYFDISQIDEAPTVDVQKVVRCKDCRHGKTPTSEPSDVRYCYCHHMFHFADYYCADGKRRRAKEGNRCD